MLPLGMGGVGKGIQRARCPRGPEELQVVETMEDSVGDDGAGAGRLPKSQCNVPLHLQQHGGERAVSLPSSPLGVALSVGDP